MGRGLVLVSTIRFGAGQPTADLARRYSRSISRRSPTAWRAGATLEATGTRRSRSAQPTVWYPLEEVGGLARRALAPYADRAIPGDLPPGEGQARNYAATIE